MLKRDLVLFMFSALVLIFTLSPGPVHALQVQGNFTVDTSASLSSAINYSGWIILEPNSTMSTAYPVSARVILLREGSTLSFGSNLSASSLIIDGGTVNVQGRLRNVSYVYNNGTINYSPNFFNATVLINKGSISHGTPFQNYSSLPYSYGGSGGGGGTNNGEYAYPETSGLNTRTAGGAAGNPGNPGSALFGSPVNLTVPIFNESELSGVAGGNGSCSHGQFGAYGLVFVTTVFNNSGMISNTGQNAGEVCYDGMLGGGGGGAGGGGAIEIIYANSASFENSGAFDTAGGAVYPYAEYGGRGGRGGNGSVLFVDLNQRFSQSNPGESSNISLSSSNATGGSRYANNDTHLNVTEDSPTNDTTKNTVNGSMSYNATTVYVYYNTTMQSMDHIATELTTLESQISSLQYSDYLLTFELDKLTANLANYTANKSTVGLLLGDMSALMNKLNDSFDGFGRQNLTPQAFSARNESPAITQPFYALAFKYGFFPPPMSKLQQNVTLYHADPPQQGIISYLVSTIGSIASFVSSTVGRILD